MERNFLFSGYFLFRMTALAFVCAAVACCSSCNMQMSTWKLSKASNYCSQTGQLCWNCAHLRRFQLATRLYYKTRGLLSLPKSNDQVRMLRFSTRSFCLLVCLCVRLKVNQLACAPGKLLSLWLSMFLRRNW